jgi:hypothetical protein
MSSPNTQGSTDTSTWQRQALTVFGLQALVILAFVFTLGTIPDPRPMLPLDPDPSPLGYTWSLALFIIPLGWLVVWLMKSQLPSPAVKAFFLTTGILIPIWILLDVFCALSFFTFENQGSVLGIHFWGFKPSEGWVKEIPIEEVIFYVTGFLAIILFYMWADHRWLSKYRRIKPHNALSRSDLMKQLFRRAPMITVITVVLIAIAWAYQQYGPNEDRGRFPGYFTFLVLFGISPCLWLLPTAGAMINWQAFSFSAFFFGVIFLCWEGTLAIPYGWWGYENKQMMGILINGFSGLPLEAALLWVSSIWTNVTLYESFRIWLSADQ